LVGVFGTGGIVIFPERSNILICLYIILLFSFFVVFFFQFLFYLQQFGVVQ